MTAVENSMPLMEKSLVKTGKKNHKKKKNRRAGGMSQLILGGVELGGVFQ